MGLASWGSVRGATLRDGGQGGIRLERNCRRRRLQSLDDAGRIVSLVANTPVL